MALTTRGLTIHAEPRRKTRSYNRSIRPSNSAGQPTDSIPQADKYLLCTGCAPHTLEVIYFLIYLNLASGGSRRARRVW